MKNNAKILAATGIVIPISYFTTGFVGLYALLVAAFLAFILVRISNKSFGGVSGDVFGASNEITRLSSLIIFASMLL
jgi:adenosylcobinamide-GDP ribazoletransferase